MSVFAKGHYMDDREKMLVLSAIHHVADAIEQLAHGVKDGLEWVGDDLARARSNLDELRDYAVVEGR